MLKRFSSTFRKDKKENGSVVSSDANGNANGDAEPKIRRNSTFGALKRRETPAAEKPPAAEPNSPDHNATREDVSDTFNAFAQLIHASNRPLPSQTGDGSYIEHKVSGSMFADLKSLGFKDVHTLMDVMKNKASGEYIDDKTMLMERTIQLVSALPPDSTTRKDLTATFVDQLWTSLPHPPLSYLGDKFMYRQADGSYNNILYPHLGAANTPYARSVNALTIQPGALPDPGVIFDAVYARHEFKEHPNKVSSILFYWASLIIHDLFQTDHHDFSLSKTSSYLDLSVLYGDNQEDQDHIRTFKDGKLKPDCFSEKRLLGFPPGCGVLLIMFNRFHNYVVDQLAVINEGGRFNKPRDGLSTELAEQAWKKYDNDLFQTGRLIVCGLYMNITLVDYVRTIVNLNRSNTTWTLDPRAEGGKVYGKDGTPSGMGNQVSAEFNLVYRWHSAISDKDDKWTQELYKKLFGKPSEEVSMQELLIGLGKLERGLHDDPVLRDFNGLKRGADGKYNDDDLVEILADSIEDVAGAFGANHVPQVLRAVEVLGMQQARAWKTGSLNEFRKFFGLKPHDSFESINRDPKVAANLRNLYEHPDFVELYPGIVAEEAKEPMVPGVGIAPTYTISRAILSDAVVLVRSDRFYTIDYNPKNLTNWGYSEVQYDMNIEQGCVWYKLFLRAFPNHFKANSIYAHFPMTVPSENQKIMRKLGRESHYSYDRPTRIAPRINLTSYIGAKYILEHQKEFNVTWNEGLGWIMDKGGLDFMLSGDTPFHTKQRQLMSKALYKDKWHQQIKEFYEYITLKLLHEKSHKMNGTNQVDITRDVGNLAHVHFAANVFSLPLKTAEHPRGVYTEHEMYMVLAVIFVCIFFDLDPAKSFPLRMAARAIGQQIGKLVEANVKAVNATGWIAGIVDSRHQNHGHLQDYGVHMIRRLLESGMGPYEVAWSQVLPTACAMVPNQAQVFTQALDYFLSEEGKVHLPEIKRLAKLDTPEADEIILHYCMEGIRMNGTFGSYRESTVDTTVDDNGRQVHIKKGDRVFVSFVDAAREEKYFPEPNVCKPDRPLESYIHYGVGPHACLGRDASRVALTAMLKTVGKLENLRRAPGPQGQLKRIPRPGGFYIYMRADHGSYFPFPTTFKINFDGDLPALPKTS
ncbi:MAG: hypothetical protein M1814_006542 [Vezdaea aestivalis]|nr:MAG: hypothetical protein M1814_006542 [Vezdaea aestivalis]